MNVGAAVRRWIDVRVVNWLGDHIGIGVRATSRELRQVQTGRIQQYMLLAVLLVVIVGAVFYFVLAGFWAKEKRRWIINTHLLSWILFVPTVAALLLLFVPGEQKGVIRWTALISQPDLVCALAYGLGRYGSESLLAANGPFYLTEQYAWYDVIKSTFHLGLDGIALVMVLLTTLLMPLVILASFKIEERVKAYMILFLLLETGMLGVFMSLDLLLFFAFWEVGLVPMYFLIAQWGGANRNYASLKFILFTMAGSLGLLLAIQMIGVLAGPLIWPSYSTSGRRWSRSKACSASSSR